MKQKIKEKTEKRSTELLIVTTLLTAIGVGATASSLDILDAGSSSGLVAEYRFDTGAGDTAYDTVGDHNGKIEGATWTDGIKGGALKFDGNNDQIPIRMKYDEAGVIDQITVCVWVKSSDSSSSQALASFDRSEYWSLSLSRKDYGNNEGTNVRWDTTDSTDSTADMGTSQSYTDGRWHHICGWFNSSSSTDKKLFIDGELKESRSSHNGNKLGTGMTRYGYIGKTTEAGSFDGGDNENFRLNGKMNNLKIYSNALTSAQIKSLYNSGSWRIGTVTDEDDPSKVAEFSFQHQNNTHVLDTSGYNNHGEKMNGVSQESAVSCKVGRCYDFDGQSDYVGLGSDSSFDMTDQITVMAWFKQGSVESDYPMIVHKAPTNDAWLMLNNQQTGSSGDRIEWRWDDGSGYHTITADNLEEDKWYHVTGTHNGTTGKIYINGRLEDSHDAAFNPQTGGDLDIGAEGDNSYYWNGMIDQVKIFNRSLSQQEIIEKTQGLEGGGTVLDLRFNQDGGDKVHDYSGENNHGTLQPNESSGPKRVKGLTGNALEFNPDEGDSVYVNTGSKLSSSIGGGSPFTVSAWVKPGDIGTRRFVATKRHRLLLVGSGEEFSSRLWDESGSNHWVNSNKQLPKDQYSHISLAVTSDKVKLFVNGNLEKEMSKDWTVNENGHNIQISGASWNSDYRNFKGEIDSVKVRTYAIKEDKAQQLYATGKSHLGSSQSSSDSSLQDGLVLSQTFDRVETCGQSDTVSCPSGMSGDVAVDESGEANHGELVNGPTEKGAGDCKVGGCLGFDDSNAENVLLSDPNGAVSSSITHSAWVKVDDTGARQITGQAQSHINAELQIENDGSAHFWMEDSSDADYNVFTDPLNDGSWHHLVGTYNNETGNMEMFVDGKKVDSANYNFVPFTSADNFKIGDGDTGYFDGSIDQVRVYNRSLSDQEVWKLYTKGRDRETGMAGAVGWWRFDSVEGNNSYDSAGENDGTIHGANLTSGIRGTALEFDGSDDYVEISGNEYSPRDKPLSVFSWVYLPDKNQDAWTGIVEKTEGNNAEGWEIQITDTKGEIRYRVRDDAGTQSLIYQSIKLDRWHHIGFTYTDSNGLTAFVDGEVVGDKDKTVGSINPTNNLQFMGSSGGTEGYTEGRLDDVRIYPYALSEEQVKQVMNSGAASVG